MDGVAAVAVRYRTVNILGAGGKTFLDNLASSAKLQTKFLIRIACARN